LTLKQEKGRRRKERNEEMSGLYSARLLTHKYSFAKTAINNL